MTQRQGHAASLAHAVTRILIGYNSVGVLSFSHISPSDVPTLLVDNASEDETVAMAEEAGYRTYRMGSNTGYARAANAGLQQLDTEFALICNPDVCISAADISTLYEAARKYPDADIFVPRIIKPSGEEFYRSDMRFERRKKDRSAPEGDACIPVISGSVLFVRRDPFLRHGGFDENIFLFFEDDDLSLRWRKAARPIIFVHSSRALHLGAKSSSVSRAVSKLKDKSLGWSWGYIMRKHAIGSLPKALAWTAGKCVAHALTLRPGKARRDVHIISGLFAAARGRRAPFPRN